MVYTFSVSKAFDFNSFKLKRTQDHALKIFWEDIAIHPELLGFVLELNSNQIHGINMR